LRTAGVTILRSHAALLPQTEKLLHDLEESTSQCHERKIGLALEEIAKSSEVVTYSMLNKESGMTYNVLRAHSSMIRKEARRLGLTFDVRA
jgi:hypothetical protein